jgi:hypothetical protein
MVAGSAGRVLYTKKKIHERSMKMWPELVVEKEPQDEQR